MFLERNATAPPVEARDIKHRILLGPFKQREESQSLAGVKGSVALPRGRSRVGHPVAILIVQLRNLELQVQMPRMATLHAERVGRKK
jgi:hypothetical protein